MNPVRTTKWRTLALATAGFNVAVVVVPIVLLNAWIARPSVAVRASRDGFVSVRGESPQSGLGGD